MMKAADLERRLKPILGWGWQSKLARALYHGQTRTVQRQVAGDVDVPDYVEAAVELLEHCVRGGLTPPARWEIADDAAVAKSAKKSR